MSLKKLQKLQKKMNKIYESDISWEAKYNLIFSKNISQKIDRLIRIDYYSPDTTYEEDVTAYVVAVNNHLEPDEDQWN